MIPDATAHLNHLGPYGRWAFVECTEIYRIESDFAAKVVGEFNQMIAGITSTAK
jgi:type III restriction enzyme